MEIQRGNWKAEVRGEQIVVWQYVIQGKVLHGAYIYKYDILKLGEEEYISKCVEHYYKDSKGEVFHHNPVTNQYSSTTYYFTGNPDFEEAEAMAVELLERRG